MACRYVRFFLFGMGHRSKLIYRDGRLLDVFTGKVIRQWPLKRDVIVPPDYRVWLETANGGSVSIVEDEQAVWVEEAGQRVAVEGTVSPVKLPGSLFLVSLVSDRHHPLATRRATHAARGGSVPAFTGTGRTQP